MEVVAFLVFVAVVVLAGGIVYAISVIGVQGESFEEALEKQRNQNKEKKKEKKAPVEKKKKHKKNKDAKATGAQEFEEDVVLVDPSGYEVETVFVEPTPAPVKKESPKPKKEEPKPKKEEPKPKKEEPKPKKEEPKPKKEDKKKDAKKPVVEEAAVAVAAPVVEAVVVKAVAAVAKAAPEPAQKSQPKPEKKKIEIVEVAEIKAEPVEEKKKKKEVKPTKEKAKKAPKSHYDEILAVVRKSPLSSTEAQGIVDVLLLKQTGKEDAEGDDWIEPGKENETKKLTRQIAELTEELEQEKVKSAGIEKKMVTVRKELVEGRALAAGHKREMEELNNLKNNEISALNTRLQQSMSQMNNAQTLNRQLESNQSHYQATINNLQTQLSQMSGAADPKLATELEHLKTASAEMASQNSNLSQQLAVKNEEVNQLTAAQNKLSSQLATAVEETGQANASLKQLQKQMEEQASGTQQQLDSQLSAKQQFDSQLSAVTAAKQQLQLELSVLKDKLSGKEVENSRLLEENERLSEQVASSVERPAADGEEAVKVNGHAEVAVKPAEEPSKDNLLEEKYAALQTTLQQIESKKSSVESELETSKEEIAKLRTKNDEVAGRLAEYKQNCTAVFTRLFPSISGGELGQMEKQAKLIIQKLEASIEESQGVEDHSEEITKLESQVSNYKNVLAQTESMLTSLQESVEKAEGEWKKKLETVESEGKSALANLKSENADLQAQLDPLNTKIKEEVASKELLAKKCAELQQLVAAGQKQLANHTNEAGLVTNGSIEEA